MQSMECEINEIIKKDLALEEAVDLSVMPLDYGMAVATAAAAATATAAVVVVVKCTKSCMPDFPYTSQNNLFLKYGIVMLLISFLSVTVRGWIT
jgi:hypothetical protein